jgi:hypothetical protein
MKNFLKQTLIEKQIGFNFFKNKSQNKRHTYLHKLGLFSQKNFGVLESYYILILKTQFKLKEINNFQFLVSEAPINFLKSVYLASYLPANFLTLAVEDNVTSLNKIKNNLGNYYAQRMFTFNKIVGSDIALNNFQTLYLSSSDTLFDLNTAHGSENSVSNSEIYNNLDPFMISPWLSDYFIISQTFQQQFGKSQKVRELQNLTLIDVNPADTKFLINYVNMLQETLLTFNQYFRNKFSFYFYAFTRKMLFNIGIYTPIILFVVFSYFDLGMYAYNSLFQTWYDAWWHLHFGFSSPRNFANQYDILVLVDILRMRFSEFTTLFNTLLLGYFFDIEEIFLGAFVFFKKIFLFIKIANFNLWILSIKSFLLFLLFRLKYLFWFLFGIVRRFGKKQGYWQFSEEWKNKNQEIYAYENLIYWNDRHDLHDLLTFKFVSSMHYNLLQIAIILGAFIFILYEIGIYIKTVVSGEDEDTIGPKNQEPAVQDEAEKLYDEMVNPKKPK